MSAAPAAVIDTLNALLEAELNSIFRFMGEGSPYLSRAAAEIRRPLSAIVVAGQRRAQELADLIDSLGGYPVPPSIQPEEQYLAFLTLKFLLPKLADAKRLTIERYQNALNALKIAPQPVISLIKRHIAEMQDELQTLQRASDELLRKKV
jgi:bacterioferritin (cytochrome b1)